MPKLLSLHHSGLQPCEWGDEAALCPERGLEPVSLEADGHGMTAWPIFGWTP